MTLTISLRDYAEQAGVDPRRVSDLVYHTPILDGMIPVVRGRRVIPLSAIPALEIELRRRGLNPRSVTPNA